jgi:hypothetical protein
MQKIMGVLIINIKPDIKLVKICILLIGVIFAGCACAGCDLRYGILETSFRLADDSRLPKWFTIPNGYARSDLNVIIDFYISPCPFCKDSVITLYGPPPHNKEIMKKAGKQRWHPLSDRDRYNKYPNTGYPNYSIITVEGTDEVFEQRRREDGDILYITDDPNITSYNNK